MTVNNRAARRSCSYARAKVSGLDTQSIARDVLLGAFGALVMVGVPFIMAVLKQMGAW